MPHSGRILCRDVIPSALRSGGPRRAYRTRALRMRHEIIFRSRTGLCVSSYKRDGPLFEVLISWFPTHSRPCFNSSRPCVSCSHAAVPRYQFVISGGDRDPYRPPPAHQLIWLSQVTPVCRSQKLLTSQATTLVTRDSEPPYPTDAVSAFDGKVFVRDVTVT